METEVKCPKCGWVEDENLNDLVTYWGEDGPQDWECGDCETLYSVSEEVTRTYDIKEVTEYHVVEVTEEDGTVYLYDSNYADSIAACEMKVDNLLRMGKTYRALDIPYPQNRTIKIIKKSVGREEIG